MIKRAILLGFALMKLAISAMATVTRAVYEGGKWVLRQVSAPASQTANAQADALTEIEALTAGAESSAEAKAAVLADVPDLSVQTGGYEDSPEREWGIAAMAIMYPLPGDDGKAAACLDVAAKAYLGRLTHDQKVTLTLYGSRRIGEHLLGMNRIPSLPRAPTYSEWQQAEYERLGRKDGVQGQGRRPEASDDEDDVHTLAA
ncbi:MULTISPECIES: hypothetical protein [unclassified Methylobacterium]|uniref:hypothetical protein n=1 Tax=unclassified Methylobacterium TaxID=2615210 RepID=UPI00226A2578|nr:MULTISPECIES: hypothetical protein [unclassified Methylobacterium]